MTTRREFIAAAGAAGVGATLGAGAAPAADAKAAGGHAAGVPFYGTHQGGIATPTQQERTFGRHKLSGAPLGQRHEFDAIDLNTVVDGRLAISRLAHIRLASPAYNDGERILRRGYSYTDGIYDGAVGGGQLFICFQRDPRAQFIPMQTRLALNDLLNEHTEHIGSAIFACPPGAAPGGFVGEGLFA